MTEDKINQLAEQDSACYKNTALTLTEVAKKLNVTTEQVRKLIRKGLLPALDVGTGIKRPLYRVTSQGLNEFLTRRRAKQLKTTHRTLKQLDSVHDYFPQLH
jgi:excisionase family DNA binding protein